jgi:serine/threonine protein kinase
MRISREHAELTLHGDRLHVRRLTTARNSIYVRGEPQEDFTVGPSEDFRIGKTTFRLTAASDKSEWQTGADRQPDEGESLTGIARQPELMRLQSVLARMENDESTRPEAWATGQPRRTPRKRQPPRPASDGTALGEYELVDQIHRCGTGQILKARHRYLQRWAAIHILSSINATGESVARFRRKARLMANFDHTNVIAAFDAGDIDGVHFLVTEYVDGWNLADLVGRQTIDALTAIDYVIQAARGLDHAHSRNVIHRDVKPAHLLLARQGVIKLIGWGRAWCTGDWSLSEHEGAGRMLGTRPFMPPEQLADSRDVDGRSDVYSLGQTMFAILTACGGAAAGTEVGPLDGNADLASPPLKFLCPDIPDALEEVYQKMTAPEITCRFQTMADVIEALSACRRGMTD